jgi:hypothetical protein
MLFKMYPLESLKLNMEPLGEITVDPTNKIIISL